MFMMETKECGGERQEEGKIGGKEKRPRGSMFIRQQQTARFSIFPIKSFGGFLFSVGNGNKG